MSLEHYKESTAQGTCRDVGPIRPLFHQQMPGGTIRGSIGGFTEG